MLRKSITLAAGVFLASAAQAAFVNNGNFEFLTGNPEPAQTFSDWTEDGAVATVATTGISGTSARLAKVGGNNSLHQNTNDPGLELTQYIVSLDFAMNDPGGAGDRGFNINLRPGTLSPTAGQINLRVVDLDADGDGDVQAYSSSPGTTGGSWQTVLTSAVAFSATESNLAVNRLTVTADLTGTPGYSVAVGSATASGVSLFQGAVPSGATLKRVAFETGNLASGAFYVVDNVTVTTVPEPAALGFLGLGSLLVMRRRRA